MTVRCPICRRPVHWEHAPSRPFCSERCRQADLGNWVTEQYRVPGEDVELPGDEDGDPEDVG